MYQIRLHTSQEQWETFVSAQPNGHLLQSWGWGELKASTDRKYLGNTWHPLRFALWDTRQEAIVAAAQILCGQPQLLPFHLSLPLQFGHLAYIPKGPVLDWSNPPLVKIFLSQLHSYLSRHGALALQMELGDIGPADPNTIIQYLTSCKNVWGTVEGVPTRAKGGSEGARHQGDHKGSPLLCYERDAVPHPSMIGAVLCGPLRERPVPPVQPLRTIMLDLTPDEDTLLANMKEKWRYNIRLAGRKGVKVRAARTDEDVRAWYNVLQITAERDHFGIHTLDYYLRAWDIFVPRNQARLFLAEYEGQLLAGIFVGLFAKQALYLYGASSNEHRSLMPNYLLQWEAIRWAKREGATCYDFWGIAETDNQGETLAGVSRFKSGWGGKIVQFPGNYEYVYHPLIMRAVRRLFHI